tara:strand:- start:2166 stop:3062 length:897 start_codon:yes stop_codon:yes gene_type:complete
MKYLLIVLLLTLASCIDNSKSLPPSTGSFSEILFVVEDLLWSTELENLASEIFRKPIEGLSKNESSNSVIQVNHNQFSRIFKTHRNIIIIQNTEQERSVRDKWAQDQIVIQLNAKSEKDIISKKLIKAKSIFDINELKFIKTSILKKSKKKEEAYIQSMFGIDVIIPDEYTVVEKSSSFFWASYNPEKKEQIKHFFVFSFTPESNPTNGQVVSKVDSIFSKYLLGAKENMFVKIEPLFPVVFEKNFYKGLWKLENGFMGGPFLIKPYFMDDKIIVSAGIIFAPNEKKRSHVKILEAIL